MTQCAAFKPRHLRPDRLDAIPAEYRNGPARRVVVLKVLPAEPPCFEPDVWRGYAVDCAEQEPRGGPLAFHNGAPMFNRGWDFCRDCKPRHAVAMDREGRCKPEFHRKPKGPGSES